MARPHTHVSMGRAAKSKYAPGFQGASEKCCLGQDESLETWGWETQDGAHSQAVPQRATPAQKRDGDAQTHSVLQALLPQTRHFDCEFLFLYPSRRYKALIYCNGVLVQEMYDFCVYELRKRLKDRLVELDATSSSTLAKAVQWALEPSSLDDPDAPFQIQTTKNPAPDA